jgi:hypothetical protein
MIDPETNITVEPDLEEFIHNNDKDFRLSTTCGGPILIPTSLKPPKPSDIKIDIGENTLYISKVQARYVSHLNKSMILNSPICELD